MIDGNTRDGRHALRRRRLPVFAARRSQRPLRQSLAEPHRWRGSRASTLLYANLSTGFRPPETTELYRLQRQQSEADLDSESLDSIEVGWKFRGDLFSLERRVLRNEEEQRDPARNEWIQREQRRHASSRLRIRGAPRRRALERCRSMARSRGTNMRSRAPSRVARPSSAATMSTPRRAICIRWRSTSGSVNPDAWRLGVDTVYVGKYFLDAANTATYPGHTVANARLAWSPAKAWRDRRCASTTFSTRDMPIAQISLSATTAISRRAGARCSCPWTTPATERNDVAWLIYIVSGLISLGFIVHCIKTGRNTIWVYVLVVLITFPFVGSAGLLRRGNPSGAAEVAHQPARHARHPHDARSGGQPPQVRKRNAGHGQRRLAPAVRG